MYKRLSFELNNTRKSLWQVCEELGVDFEWVDPKLLELDQCSHCGLWSRNLIPDLDKNPICTYCLQLAGM